MGKGDHSKTHLLGTFYQSTPSCLKVRGGDWECAGGLFELPLVLDLAEDEERGSFFDTFSICIFLPEHSFMLKSYGAGVCRRPCGGGPQPMCF